jgi:hypothetical protein
MGNNQSQHAPSHNKLSKPKTNTNSPPVAPTKLVDSPVSVSSKYANISVQDRQMLKATLTSPFQHETDSGTSYDARDGLGELATRMQSRLSSITRSEPSTSIHKSGRTSTLKLASLPGSNISHIPAPQHVDMHTTIQILQGVKKSSSREDLKALHQALQPIASPPSPTTPKELKRRTSLMNRSSLSLIRRRSLVTTPGVATRDSPTESTRRWSSWRKPQLSPEEVAKWERSAMVGNSPLTRIAALDLMERSETPTPRAQTPGDMEYTHLGSLKLGSLIVTNGAASPAPSSRTERPNSKSKLGPEVDYFTPSDGSSSPLTKRLPTKWGHSRSKSTVATKAPPLQRNLSISDEIRRAKTMSRCDSPVKVEKQHLLVFDNEVEEVEEFKMRLRVINKSADTLARAYMAEMPSSPFIDHDAPLPAMHFDMGQEIQHKSSAPHDEGFSDSFLEDGVSYREEAFRILEGTTLNDPPTTLDLPCISTPTQPYSSSSRDVTPKSERPSPRKADSGYSSGGSFKTLHRETKREATPKATIPKLSKKPSLVADMLKSGDDAASLYTFDQMVSLPPEKALTPTPKDDIVKTRPAHLQLHALSTSHTNTPPSVLSPGTPVSGASVFTNDSQNNNPTPKRLQRRRPSQSELPIVQSCSPIPDGSIPNIPVSVRAQFVRRLSEQPTMECLTQTYLSKEHVNSSDLAIDAPTATSNGVHVPSGTPEHRGRHHTRSHTERPSDDRPKSLMRSMTLFRSRSSVGRKEESSRQNENASPELIDFGTAAQMLGSSPYDAATPTPKASKTPRTTVTLPTHPHQLGHALPRAKSMVHMDSATAADFARMRSKDRAEGPPEMLQRPKSYQQDSNENVPKSKSSKKKRHSTYVNIHSASTDVVSRTRDASPQVEVEEQQRPGHTVFARSTGRGPVVAQMVDKFDEHGKPTRQIPTQTKQPDWDSHARLWSQRRKSIGEGLRQQSSDPVISSAPLRAVRPSSQPHEQIVLDRYSGGLQYGYERGYGVGGSAGTRQLHSVSWANRKSMHYRDAYGVDLSDVPIFVQRC